MILRRLGSTDIHVSAIGLGTVKFGRNQQVKYPAAFDLPHDAEIVNLLAQAKAMGITLLDTAPAYGSSEERLGKLLTNRGDWVICTKVGEEFSYGTSHYDFSSLAVTKSIERSLQRLNTDYLDIVLVHSNGDDQKIILETEVFSVLAGLKQCGKIRAYGMSTKTIEGGILALQRADVAMVTYNPVDTQELPVLDFAAQQHKGILIKKALASGHLHKIPGDDPVRNSLQFILQHSGVSSVIIGTLSAAHLQQARNALG